MRFFFLITFLGLSIFLNAQKYLDLQTGFNYPINYTSNDLFRKLGYEIGICAGKKINNKIGIETGLNIYYFGRKKMEQYYERFYRVTGEKFLVKGYEDRFLIEANIPILLKYKFDKSKISVKSGFLILGQNLLLFSDWEESETVYYLDVDNEKNNFEYEFYGFDFFIENRKSINLGFNLNFMFDISERTRTFVDYKTSLKFKGLYYGLITMGFNFNIANR